MPPPWPLIFWRPQIGNKNLAILTFSIDQNNKFFDQSPTLGQVITKYVANQLKKFYGADEKNLYYLGHQTYLALVAFDQENSKLIQTIETLMYQTSQLLRIGRYDVEILLRAGISIYGADEFNQNYS
jgi:hypothetical protein